MIPTRQVKEFFVAHLLQKGFSTFCRRQLLRQRYSTRRRRLTSIKVCMNRALYIPPLLILYNYIYIIIA